MPTSRSHPQGLQCLGWAPENFTFKNADADLVEHIVRIVSLDHSLRNKSSAFPFYSSFPYIELHE